MESSANAKKSAALRIWHWANMLAIFGLLATGFLRETYMSWRTTSAVIVSKMAEAGSPIAADLAKDIAVAIRTPMWENHYVFGFAMAALLLGRIAISFVPGQSTVVSDFRRAVREHDLHALSVKAIYIAFYGLIGFMAVSGVLMYFRAELALSKEFVGSLKSGHELFQWIIAGFVALHVVGLFVAEIRGDRGIVSGMIHGGGD